MGSYTAPMVVLHHWLASRQVGAGSLPDEVGSSPRPQRSTQEEQTGRPAGEFPLQSFTNRAGVGSSTSTIDASLDHLFGDEPHYLNVSAGMSGEGTPPASPAPTSPRPPWCRVPADPSLT